MEEFPYRKDSANPVRVYSQHRGKILTGDLLLCAGVYKFSRLIQLATDSCWSHVAFVIRQDSIGRVMVLESVEPQGVRTVPLRKYLTDYKGGKPYKGGVAIARHKGFSKILSNQQSSNELKKFGKFAVDQFGYPYDGDQIAKLAGRVIRRWFIGEDTTAFDKDNEFICSEYVDICYRKVGISIKAGSHGFVAPADFANDKNVKIKWVIKNPD